MASNKEKSQVWIRRLTPGKRPHKLRVEALTRLVETPPNNRLVIETMIELGTRPHDTINLEENELTDLANRWLKEHAASVEIHAVAFYLAAQGLWPDGIFYKFFMPNVGDLSMTMPEAAGKLWKERDTRPIEWRMVTTAFVIKNFDPFPVNDDIAAYCRVAMTDRSTEPGRIKETVEMAFASNLWRDYSELRMALVRISAIYPDVMKKIDANWRTFWDALIANIDTGVDVTKIHETTTAHVVALIRRHIKELSMAQVDHLIERRKTMGVLALSFDLLKLNLPEKQAKKLIDKIVTALQYVETSHRLERIGLVDPRKNIEDLAEFTPDIALRLLCGNMSHQLGLTTVNFKKFVGAFRNQPAELHRLFKKLLANGEPLIRDLLTYLKIIEAWSPEEAHKDLSYWMNEQKKDWWRSEDDRDIDRLIELIIRWGLQAGKLFVPEMSARFIQAGYEPFDDEWAGENLLPMQAKVHEGREPLIWKPWQQREVAIRALLAQLPTDRGLVSFLLTLARKMGGSQCLVYMKEVLDEVEKERPLIYLLLANYAYALPDKQWLNRILEEIQEVAATLIERFDLFEKCLDHQNKRAFLAGELRTNYRAFFHLWKNHRRLIEKLYDDQLAEVALGHLALERDPHSFCATFIDELEEKEKNAATTHAMSWLGTIPVYQLQTAELHRWISWAYEMVIVRHGRNETVRDICRELIDNTNAAVAECALGVFDAHYGAYEKKTIED